MTNNRLEELLASMLTQSERIEDAEMNGELSATERAWRGWRHALALAGMVKKLARERSGESRKKKGVK